MSKLHLEFNPYTYTRVQVMRTLLVSKQGYDRMMKLSFTEIADYLAKTTYRKEMEKLGLRYSGADLLEHALNFNLKNTFSKIKRIADPSLREALETYLQREDFNILKVLLRSMISGIPVSDSQFEELTLEVGILKKGKIEHMKQAKTAQELLMFSGLVDMKKFNDLVKSQNFDLNEMDNRLDKAYYAKIMDFTKTLSRQGTRLAQFLRYEIFITNLLTIAKFIKLGKSREDVLRHIIPTGHARTMTKLKKMAEAKSLEQMLPFIRGTPYYSVFKQFSKEGQSMLFFKTSLQSQLIKTSLRLMRQDPLSVNTVIGYALMKEQEVKNLKVIIKGKQLGVDEKLIEEALVL